MWIVCGRESLTPCLCNRSLSEPAATKVHGKYQMIVLVIVSRQQAIPTLVSWRDVASPHITYAYGMRTILSEPAAMDRAGVGVRVGVSGQGQGWSWGLGLGSGLHYSERACGHELHDDAEVRLLDHSPYEVDHVAVTHLVRVRVRVLGLG